MKTFESIDLYAPLKRALAEQEYVTPTPIQAQAIPAAVAGQDILGCAQTGTGKTAAFALPILDFLGHEKPRAAANRPTTLVLAPTRELAIQIGDSFRRYGKHMKFHSALVYGGVGQAGQVNSMRQGVDVLIATPGRLIDLMEQGHINLRDVQVFVLDEADRMLDMGFLPALRRVLAALPKERQTLLFSATFADEIKQLATQFMRNPEQVQIAARNSVATTVTHRLHPVNNDQKRDLLLHLLSEDSRRQTLVFSRTKHGADKLVKHLERAGLKAAAIHGNKSQGARTRALDDFKAGRVTTLVATDIAARGLDIDQLPAVINYDLPMVAEDYVHRIGRTGRAGAAGIAISLVSHDEAPKLRAIQRLIGRDIEQKVIAGFEPQSSLNLNNPNPPRQKPARPRTPGGRPPAGQQPRGHHAGARTGRSGSGNGGQPRSSSGQGRRG